MMKETRNRIKHPDKQFSPLDQLKYERELLDMECKEIEDRMSEKWSYLSNNIGTLLVDSATDSLRHRFFGTPKRSERKAEDEDNSLQRRGRNIGSKIMSGLMLSAPMIWNVVEPMVTDMAMEKLRSLFSNKKRPSRDDYYHDDYYYEDERPRTKRKRKKKRFFWQKKR